MNLMDTNERQIIAFFAREKPIECLCLVMIIVMY